MGQKASDHTCIPLCARHHRTGPLAYHHLGEKEFRRVHKLDVRELAQRLSWKPVITIERYSRLSGPLHVGAIWFVVTFPEPEYINGTLRFDVAFGAPYVFARVKELRTELFRNEFRQRRRAA